MSVYCSSWKYVRNFIACSDGGLLGSLCLSYWVLDWGLCVGQILGLAEICVLVKVGVSLGLCDGKVECLRWVSVLVILRACQESLYW